MAFEHYLESSCLLGLYPKESGPNFAVSRKLCLPECLLIYPIRLNSNKKRTLGNCLLFPELFEAYSN